MKKCILILCCLFLIRDIISAQYVVIPDDNFRNFLMNKYPSCFDDGTGRLNITCNSVLTEDTMIVSGANDLTGIQYFKSLKYLDCRGSNLNDTTILLLPSTLKYLDCSYCGLTASTIFPSSLTTLKCPWCFYMDDQALGLAVFTSHFPAFPPNLTYLDCSNNGSVLNFDVPASLTYLNCSQDGLGSLGNLPPNLEYLDCSNQYDMPSEPKPRLLHSLPTLPKTLKTLICSSNAISDLSLPDSLIYLDCSDMYSGNTADVPDTYTPTLYYLPTLPVTLKTLICSEPISCIPNPPPGLQATLYAYLTSDIIPFPACVPPPDTNPSIISGNIFYDLNSNGVQDADEVNASLYKIKITNGQKTRYTYTDTSGKYYIAADSLGTYTLSASAPVYYKTVPSSYTYTFGKYDSTITSQDFALQPTASIDSFMINVISLNPKPVPGQNFSYLISYKNVGTTTAAANIVFGFSKILLDFDSSNNSSVINNGNNLSLPVNNLSPGQQGSLIVYFTLKTSDVPGEVLFTNARITANSAIATDSIVNVIRSSYDPNDKEATPLLTPAEVANGKQINYTIHFQNTGTANAQNIIILDALNNSLIPSSVQLIKYSHPCTVTINGNIISFKFSNINLPDSSDNLKASQGYVSFSVSPSVFSNNTTVLNYASIYFDYNAVVNTNTASTTISDGTVPLKLLSFSGLVQPGTDNALLYWNTANEINTKSFVIEISTDGTLFTPITSVRAKGYNGNHYTYAVAMNSSIVYYRLKMIDNNGEFTYSSVVRITGLQNEENFMVLINPVTTKLSIKIIAPLLTNTVANIFNSEGKIVKSFTLRQGTQTIDVSNLSSGLYYIKTELVTRKIMINR